MTHNPNNHPGMLDVRRWAFFGPLQASMTDRNPGMHGPELDQPRAWAHAARKLGEEHGRNAASWIVDGNTKPEAVAHVVALIDAGDDWDDYRPGFPNLSGEWADDLTPAKLFEEITGMDAHAEASWNADAYQSVLEDLCTAYEEGVSATFEPECERILRAAAE